MIHFFSFISPVIPKLFGKFVRERTWNLKPGTLFKTVLKLYFHHKCYTEMLKLRTLNRRSQTGSQQEFFRSRELFWNLSISINTSSKIYKKGHADKHFGAVFLDTLKAKFWMKNLTKRWTQSGPFYLISDHFSRSSK